MYLLIIDNFSSNSSLDLRQSYPYKLNHYVYYLRIPNPYKARIVALSWRLCCLTLIHN